jgi:hypothetical protein
MAKAAHLTNTGPRSASDRCIEVRPYAEQDESALRQFVATHPDGLVYYTPQYRRFLLAVLGPSCRCAYRVAWSGEEPTGILPLMAFDAPFGRVLNSLPFFGSNGGVLAADAASEQMLRREYERLTRAPDVACATWISHPMHSYDVPSHDYEDERIAQWTVIPDGANRETVMALAEASARRNFSKAERLGVTVRESPAELPFLEEVHRQNMAAIGGRAKPHSFFEELPRTMEFGRDWTLYVAALAGRPIAALLLFMMGRTTEYVMPAIVESEREVQPTAALIATAMIDAARRGRTLWNWGGTWLTQNSVYRFKRKWGAREQRYRYYTTLNDRSLLHSTAADLGAACPDFYTVPFGLLQAGPR